MRLWWLIGSVHLLLWVHRFREDDRPQRLSHPHRQLDLLWGIERTCEGSPLKPSASPKGSRG